VSALRSNRKPAGLLMQLTGILKFKNDPLVGRSESCPVNGHVFKRTAIERTYGCSFASYYALFWMRFDPPYPMRDIRWPP
jgi:hypothetical protein